MIEIVLAESLRTVLITCIHLSVGEHLRLRRSTPCPRRPYTPPTPKLERIQENFRAETITPYRTRTGGGDEAVEVRCGRTMEAGYSEWCQMSTTCTPTKQQQGRDFPVSPSKAAKHSHYPRGEFHLRPPLLPSSCSPTKSVSIRTQVTQKSQQPQVLRCMAYALHAGPKTNSRPLPRKMENKNAG